MLLYGHILWKIWVTEGCHKNTFRLCRQHFQILLEILCRFFTLIYIFLTLTKFQNFLTHNEISWLFLDSLRIFFLTLSWPKGTLLFLWQWIFKIDHTTQGWHWWLSKWNIFFLIYRLYICGSSWIRTWVILSNLFSYIISCYNFRTLYLRYATWSVTVMITIYYAILWLVFTWSPYPWSPVEITPVFTTFVDITPVCTTFMFHDSLWHHNGSWRC